MPNNKLSNHHLPPYMGNTYADIIRWCNTFYQEAPPYRNIFNISAMDFAVTQQSFEAFRTLFNCRNNVANYSKEITQQLHDLMFYWDVSHPVNIPVAPAGLGLETAFLNPGGFITKINEWWNTLIKPSPSYTEEIGKLLGFIHTPKPHPAPENLVAESRIVCDGAQVKIFTNLPAPADAQSIYVDKHDGAGMTFVNAVNTSHYEYAGGAGGLPEEEKLWTFKVALRVKGQDIGTAAYVNVPVKKV